MNWRLEFLPEAEKEFAALAGNQRILVAKALKKVQQNPVSIYEGGYGKPLGNKGGTDLTGLFKIKLKAAGLRVVYKLIQTETEMLVVVVGARELQLKNGGEEKYPIPSVSHEKEKSNDRQRYLPVANDHQNVQSGSERL